MNIQGITWHLRNGIQNNIGRSFNVQLLAQNNTKAKIVVYFSLPLRLVFILIVPFKNV